MEGGNSISKSKKKKLRKQSNKSSLGDHAEMRTPESYEQQIKNLVLKNEVLSRELSLAEQTIEQQNKLLSYFQKRLFPQPPQTSVMDCTCACASACASSTSFGSKKHNTRGLSAKNLASFNAKKFTPGYGKKQMENSALKKDTLSSKLNASNQADNQNIFLSDPIKFKLAAMGTIIDQISHTFDDVYKSVIHPDVKSTSSVSSDISSIVEKSESHDVMANGSVSGWSSPGNDFLTLDEDGPALHQDCPSTLLHREEPSTLLHREEPSTLLHQGEPSTLLHQGEPSTFLHQEEPSTFLHQEEPSTLLHQEEPSTLLHQDEPSTLLHQDDPSTFLHQDDPLTLLHQDDPTILLHQDDPSALLHQDDPLTLLHQNDPSTLLQQDDPLTLLQDDPLVMYPNDPPILHPGDLPTLDLCQRAGSPFLHQDDFSVSHQTDPSAMH